MTEQKKVEREGAGSAETSHIAADPTPARRRRLTAARKQDAVLRVLRGEDVELVARSLEVTAADVSNWRDAFLAAGSSGLKQRPRDARDEEIDRLRAKVGEITMDNELLYEKIAKMEAGHPFARRRSKR
jgi:transposase-like protein